MSGFKIIYFLTYFWKVFVYLGNVSKYFMRKGVI